MDDSLPNTTQNSQLKTQNTNQDDNQVQQPPQVAPSHPVGSISKEFGPIGASVEVKPEEYIKPSGAEVEPIIPDEVKEHIEVVSDREKPQLTPSHKAVGIHPAKESVSVAVHPQQTIVLPMTEEEALHTIKTTGVTDSKHWLAILIEKAYEQMRNVHRKITN